MPDDLADGRAAVALAGDGIVYRRPRHTGAAALLVGSAQPPGTRALPARHSRSHPAAYTCARIEVGTPHAAVSCTQAAAAACVA